MLHLQCMHTGGIATNYPPHPLLALCDPSIGASEEAARDNFITPQCCQGLYFAVRMSGGPTVLHSNHARCVALSYLWHYMMCSCISFNLVALQIWNAAKCSALNQLYGCNVLELILLHCIVLHSFAIFCILLQSVTLHCWCAAGAAWCCSM